MKILTVDDSALNLKLLQVALEANGHGVLPAGNGIEALRQLELNEVDAIISDILMSKMDGYRLCFEIRRNPRWHNLPFIFYTATYTAPSDEKLAFDLGADAYLRKPATANEILEVLIRVTRNDAKSRIKPRTALPEIEVMKEYSERLVAKLVEKNQELAELTHELTRNQHHFRTVLDTVPECVKLLDREGRLLDINHAGLSILEADSAEAIRGQCLYPLVAEKYRKIFQTMIEQSFAGQSNRLQFEIINCKGHQRWMETNAVPLWADNQRQNVKAALCVTRDITERKHTEEALRQSREEFKDLFDNAPIAYHEVDAQGRLARINEAELKMLGYTAEELLGQYVWKISANEAVSRQAVLEKLRDVPPPPTFERLLRRKDGSVFPALIEDQLMRGPDGAVCGIRAVIQDITERKRIEKEAAREQARFQFIFGSVPVGITWMERGHAASRLVNPANERLTGVPAERCRQVELYRQATHPDDRPRQDELHRQMLAGEIDHYSMEKRYVHADGTIAWIMLTVRSFPDPANDRIQEITTMMDITERKKVETALRESEERFRQLAENITEVFWVTDVTSGKILYLSPAYAAIWGRSCQSLYDSPDSWNEATHSEDRERIREAFAVAVQRNFFDETYRIVRPDGSTRWIHDRGVPIRDATGKVYRLVGLAEDITQRRQLEGQVLQAQKMDAMGTLAGGIAHDFNNILTAITGYTELAKMAIGNNPKAREFLDNVSQASARAVDLVRQILTFSRQQEQQLRPIQLQAIVEEALKLLRATIPATIQFKTSYDPELPAILADATQVHQVLLNLGTNAWHAMKDCPGRLEVKLEAFEVDAHLAEVQPRLRAGHYVRLSLSDTGQGMDRATQNRIFEPFFTTKAPGEGTGLGLSVVLGIMQNHGGAITVYSEPGEGTTFHLYFPALFNQESKIHEQARPVPQGGGRRILYVDDEAPLAQLGQMTLERLGYKVETQTSVVDALNLVRADPARFDLVITDQAMPGMTGVDFAVQLLKIRANLPIILTTGYAANLTVERIRALGIRDLLPKPHTVHALATTIDRVLSAEKPS